MAETREPVGRLELTWTNKARTLLSQEDGTYEWVEPGDRRVSEVRLLQDVATVGDISAKRSADNLLIRGDALNALQALNRIPEFAREYAGKVRLVYIDPPFNTGQAFPQYDDNLEHSVWLTMLRDRLVQIKGLLAANASVWVHLDDVEVHRCRVVLDEVFGAENFVATVIWEKRYSRSNDAAFSISHDYLLVYRSTAAWTRAHRLGRGVDAQYSNPDDDPGGPWRGIPWDAPEERAGLDYAIPTPTGQKKRPPKGRHWSGTQANWLEIVAQGRDYYGKSGSGMPNVKRYLSEMPGLVPHTVWSHEEVGHNDQATKEIKALFPGTTPFSTPKPERLLQRIIHLSTDRGDIVLDCFAGSGTTAAVAQKMGRRWVTVEASADTVATFTLPRLSMVIRGADLGGVSTTEIPVGEGLPDGVATGAAKAAAKTIKSFVEGGYFAEYGEQEVTLIERLIKDLRAAERTTTETTWSGGGGFRVLDVGPSMFQEVAGRIYLAEWATNGALGEATAAQLGYDYASDPPFCGTKGRVRLAVVDGLVNEGVIRLLVDALPPGQRICVCGTAIDPEARPILRSLAPGSTMKKVPAALLDEYRAPRRERLALANILDWSEALNLIDVDDPEPVDA